MTIHPNGVHASTARHCSAATATLQQRHTAASLSHSIRSAHTHSSHDQLRTLQWHVHCAQARTLRSFIRTRDQRRSMRPMQWRTVAIMHPACDLSDNGLQAWHWLATAALHVQWTVSSRANASERATCAGRLAHSSASHHHSRTLPMSMCCCLLIQARAAPAARLRAFW